MPTTPTPTQTQPRQAVAYIRASTDDQVNSLEVQRQKLEAYCAYKGITLVEVFTDAGVSGSTPFDERAEGAALLAFRADTGIGEVIFTKVDRAFRDAADCLITFRTLDQAGIQVHALDLDLDTSTANGRLMLGMLALLAEWELHRRRERQAETLAVLRAQSRRIGEIPYGYLAITDDTLPLSKRDNPGQRLIPSPDEQAILEDIFTHARIGSGGGGMGAHAIATRLNQAGVPAKKGGRWHPIVVQSLLDHATLADGRTAQDF